MRDSRSVFLNKNALKDILILPLSSHCGSKNSNPWPVEQVEHFSAKLRLLVTVDFVRIEAMSLSWYV